MLKRSRIGHKFIGHVCWPYITARLITPSFEIVRVKVASEVLLAELGDLINRRVGLFEQPFFYKDAASAAHVVSSIIDIVGDHVRRRPYRFLVQEFQYSVIALSHPGHSGAHMPVLTVPRNSFIGAYYVGQTYTHCGTRILGLILSTDSLNGDSNDCSTGQQVHTKTGRVGGTTRHAVVNKERNCMSTEYPNAQESTGLQDDELSCPSCGEEIYDIFDGEITGRRASPCGCALTRHAIASVDAQLSGRPADKSVSDDGRLYLFDDGRETATHLESDTTCKDIVGVDPR